MADHPSFALWEPQWHLYGPLVFQVAHNLEPLAGEAEINAQIVASAAAGFLDVHNIDPLSALLLGLLQNRPRTDRIRVAQCLVDSGIDPQRALEATRSANVPANAPAKARTEEPRPRRVTRSLAQTRTPRLITTQPSTRHPLTPLTPFTPLTRDNQTPQEFIDPTFANIRRHAIGLWEQQSLSPQDNVPRATAGLQQPRARDRNRRLKVDDEQTEAEHAEENRRDEETRSLDLARHTKRRRRNAIAGLLFFLVAGGVAGKVLGLTMTSRKLNKRGAPLLLTVKDLPKQWELTCASAHQPASIFQPTTVFQRFVSRDKRHTVLVTTIREDERFSDPALGKPRVSPDILASSRMTIQAQATATDSFPVHSAPNRPVMMEWKQPTIPFTMSQSATTVYLQATGMPSRDVRDFGRALRARSDLLKNGWAAPKDFTESMVVPQRTVRIGVQSSLSFRSTVDGTTHITIQTRYADTPALTLSDIDDATETVTLSSGREVKSRRGWSHTYSWEERGIAFDATVSRGTYGVESESTQQSEFVYPYVEPLPDRHLDGVLDLLNRVQLGNDEQWRSLTAGYQASLHRLPSLGKAKVGDHEIETRGLRVGQVGKGVVATTPMALCAYSVCAPVYRSWDRLALEADLLINDHWWHFRQIANYDRLIPKYFTSPPADKTPTGEHKFDRVYKWWAIDLGTEAQAARNESEPTLLLRPLPR
jgi:hypothetical protein